MDIDTLLQQGEELYSQSCIICHFGGDGGGLNPSLITSSTVKGPAEGLIKLILKGQSGISIVNGKKLNGIMPPQANMNDVEIAAVATYVRREFGKVEEPVQPSEVAKVRALP
jgi:mono/diheme cytochrome c family protein